jgi:xanthine dehydrogenase molybdenum-binding subunit
MGYCLTEDLKLEEGRVLNPDFTDYKLPAATDLPEFDIDFVETHDPDGPFGAKGIGEAPLIPVAVAIANAVRHATGVRFNELPLTPERVFMKLREMCASGPSEAPPGAGRPGLGD